jgi:ABC-2 type transport system ATP-binding protein
MTLWRGWRINWISLLQSYAKAEARSMIVFENLQKVVSHTTVLDIETLKVEAGESVAVVGPVDSGIEPLLEIILGQTNPTAGRVTMDGIEPYLDKALFGRRVGVLFPENNLYARMTVEANLKFYGRLRRMPKGRAEDVMRQVGLADHARVRAEDLPSGLARRLAFGRAILHNPAILILAEPFRKCDEGSVTLLSGLIRQIASEGNAILILGEDDDNLDAVCNTIYRLEKGQIVDSYRPGEARHRDMPFMIPAKQEGKVDLVDPADIYYVMAQDDRTYLQTTDGQLPTQFTLAELEKRLARSGFFRAHRSYLVNLQHVKEVIPFTRDSYTLRLKDEDGTQIPLSKSAAKELRELLGY